MKILIDIGHPADFYLFRHTIQKLKAKNHEIFITVKKKECLIEILNNLQFDFICLGKSYRNIVIKVISSISYSVKMCKIAHNYKPDLFLSHGSVSAVFVAKVMGKPHISLEDTGNREQVLLYKPFTHVILSPQSFRPHFGRNHIKYKGYHELAYLHPNYFKPDRSVLDMLGVDQEEKFVIVRFSGQGATHDFGYSGISLKNKMRCVEEFKKYAKIFISSEAPLPSSLEEFKINIHPEKMHDVIYYATLVYTEGATIASEASILGTPVIHVYFRELDYIRDQEKKYRTIFYFGDSLKAQEESIQKGIALLNDPAIKKQWREKRKGILNDTIDVTAFLVWFIEYYPESREIVKQNPEYQLQFK